MKCRWRENMVLFFPKWGIICLFALFLITMPQKGQDSKKTACFKLVKGKWLAIHKIWYKKWKIEYNSSHKVDKWYEQNLHYMKYYDKNLESVQYW